MVLNTSFTLNTGYTIPAQSKPDEVRNAVEVALKSGYRHIDAASVYGNEKEVGAGIKASGVDRMDIFIASKLWNTDHEPQYVLPALERTLRDLQVDYLDLYLIHFPISFPHLPEAFPVNPETEEIWVTDTPISATWKAMEDLLQTGKVRSIGVSNFTRARIEEMMKTATVLPAVNQIEGHPYLQQPGLLEWHKSKARWHPIRSCLNSAYSETQGIVTVAYSPMGNNIYNLPRCVDDPVIKEIAQKLNVQTRQVLVSWAVQRGTCVLPKSVAPSRIVENLKVFEIPEPYFNQVSKLDRHHRYNFPARIGVDIFGEVDQATLRKKVEEWKAEQRLLKAKK